MLKILVTTGIYPPDIGGPATYSKLLKDELPKYGAEAEILSYGAVKHLPKGISHLVYFFKVLKLSQKADFIYAQDTVSVGLPSALVAKLTGKKFVLRVPGDYAWEQSVQRFGVKESVDEFQNKKYSFRVEFLRTLQKLTANLADLVITPSAYFKSLVAKWVKDPAKVKLIYNGIAFGQQTVLPWPGREKVLVSAGRLVPWKAFSFLVDLMQDLPDYKLEIYGHGPELGNLQEKIKILGLNDRVFLKGQVAREEMLAVLAKSFVFIFNSSFESFSFQIVEAMNAGTPVIAANIGNLEEIIETGKEGLLVELNNKTDFLEALKRVSQDAEFVETIIKNAQVKSQTFSIEKSLGLLVSALENLRSK